MNIYNPDLPDVLPTTPNPFDTDPNAGLVPFETMTLALQSLTQSAKTLKLAGIEPKLIKELTAKLHESVTREGDRRTTEVERRKKLDHPELVFAEGPKPTPILPTKPLPPATGRKLFSGPILKLQRGQGGFAALWKERWVVIERGWIKCYQSAARPEPSTIVKRVNDDGTDAVQDPHTNTPIMIDEEKPSVHLPLTEKTTTIDTLLSKAFTKKFKSLYPFEITTLDQFGSRRSLTFNCLTDKTRRQWIEAINKGTIQTKVSEPTNTHITAHHSTSHHITPTTNRKMISSHPRRASSKRPKTATWRC